MVTVDRGGSTQEVVCGAPNVPDAGGLVVLAPLGTYLPAKGMTIEKRAIAGVTSEGMLCSEGELGLGHDSRADEGILVLAAGSASPGTAFAKAFPAARDAVYEIGLTPNRPDGLGHLGLAREAAALFGVPFAPPCGGAAGVDAPGGAREVRRRGDRGRRALPPLRRGGARGRQDRAVAARGALSALGARGAFRLERRRRHEPRDARLRPSDARVRPRSPPRSAHRRPPRAAGEKLKTLDGVDRALDEDDLVICDGRGPVALAGVMGGADSEIVAADDARAARVRLLRAAWRAPHRAPPRHAHRVEPPLRARRRLRATLAQAALARAVSLVAEALEAAAAVEETPHRRGPPATRAPDGPPAPRPPRAAARRDPDGSLPFGRGDARQAGLVLRSKPTPDAGERDVDRPELPPRRGARGRPHRGGRAHGRHGRHPRGPPAHPSLARRGPRRGARAEGARRRRGAGAERGHDLRLREPRGPRGRGRPAGDDEAAKSDDRGPLGHAHEPRARAPPRRRQRAAPRRARGAPLRRRPPLPGAAGGRLCPARGAARVHGPSSCGRPPGALAAQARSRSTCGMPRGSPRPSSRAS